MAKNGTNTSGTYLICYEKISSSSRLIFLEDTEYNIEHSVLSV